MYKAMRLSIGSIALVCAAQTAGAQQSLQWPVTAPRITQDFACYDCVTQIPNLFHTGIDITDATDTTCDEDGPAVKAAAGGTVHRTVYGCAPGSASCGVYGNHVIVKHSETAYHLYAHLREVDNEVFAGTTVVAGQTLGIMGATGTVTGCHVHFAVANFPPEPSGDHPELLGSGATGINAYTSAHPASGCGAGSCLDPKDGLPHQELRIGGAASYIVTETPFTGSDCVANVESEQSFVAIAQSGGSYYIHLPSWVGPSAETGGTGTCQSESTYGWVAPVVGSPTGPFEVEVNGPAVGSGWLNVRLDPDPQGQILTRIWPGQRFWRTGQASAPTPSECDEFWWEIFTPKSRTGGHGRGWVCGDYLTGGSCPVPLGNGRYQMVLGGCGGGEPPVVTTTPASAITQQTASLNMQVNPGGLTTNAWFRWGLSPSVPNVTSTINVGAGTSTVAVGQTLGGLDCDTTYFFQAWAENAEGQDSGQVLSFDTSSCGGGGTDPVDLIENGDFLDDDDHWTLIGDFYADRRFNTHNFDPGYAYLSELDGSPGNNLLGTIYQQVTIPANAESALLRYWVSISTSEPGGPAQDFLNATLQDDNGDFLAGLELLSNQNSSGGSYILRQFNLVNFIGETIRIHFLGTTNSTNPTVFRIDNMSLVAEVASGGPPEVATEPADQIGDESARLNMTVDPNGLPTEVWFDLEADDSTPNDDTIHLSIGSGTGPQLVSLNVFQLDCDTLYYFRARASNDQGSDQGVVLSFSTDDCPGAPPHADTDPVDNLTSSSARLRAEIIPSGASTQGWFEWGETTALGTLTPQQSVGSGTSDVLITSTINGLDCDTTYYYNSFASNAHGTDDGAIHSFTTLECPPPPPTVTTLPADEIAQSSARLNGAVTPNGSATTAWFEWGLTPTLGSFTPPEQIGSGGSGIPISSTIAGLACETTHYFRASAENGGGLASGATLSFVTPMCVSLEANFVAAPVSGTVPLEVQFTDLSSGEPTEWLWHFGDGSSSTEQHPIHVYEEPGVYSVRLRVGQGLASAVAVQNALIEATTSPVSLLPSFIDLATQAGGAVDIGRIIGAEPDDRIASNSVSVDINRDGLRDLVLASTRSDPLGRSNAGSVFVIWDVASQAMPIDLADPTLVMTKVIGRLPDDRLGISLHVADVNGDSYPDILVGSSSADAPDIVDAGVVYIVYGSADMASIPLLDLATPPGSEPMLVTRIYGLYEGNSVGGELAAGDVNADGVADAVLGLPTSWAVGRQQAGVVVVLFGGDYIDEIREANLTFPFDYFLIWGAHAFDVTGSSIATGDVDGDGIDDLVFGAANSDTPNGLVSGRAYIVYGGEHVVSGSGIDLADLPSGDEPATLILGRTEVDFFGWDVDVADVDGDGRQEALFSAVFGDYPGRMDAGEVNIVWGSEGLRSIEQIDLLASPTGVTRIVGGQAGDWLGYSFAAGDISGDGRADLAMGAPGPIPQVVGQEPGRVYVVYGISSLKALSLFDVAAPAAGVKLTQIVGPGSQDEFASIITLGSIAGDPRVEILAAAPVSDPVGRMNAGEVFSVGTTDGLLFADGFEAGDVSAWSSAVGVP